jgi:hypothetical protein
MSRKHVKGRSRSARASCVAAGSKVARDRRDADRKDGEPADPAAPTPGGGVAAPGADSDSQAGADPTHTSDSDAGVVVDGVLDLGVDGEDAGEDPGE